MGSTDEHIFLFPQKEVLWDPRNLELKYDAVSVREVQRPAQGTVCS